LKDLYYDAQSEKHQTTVDVQRNLVTK